MNQSNKALREALIDIMIDEDRDASYETGWGLDVEKAADRAIALVTNHIKGKMPKEGKFPLLGCDKHWSDDSSGTCSCDENQRAAQKGYRQALDEVSQILKEMGE